MSDDEEKFYVEKEDDPFPLWGGDPNCKHEVISAGPGGGVKCRKCPAWFCF